MTEDTREVHEHVVSLLGATGTASALDPGCGRGEHLRMLAETMPADARLVGLDFRESVLEEARSAVGEDPRFVFLQHDMNESLPFENGEFDRVMSVNTLEAIPAKGAFALELHRVLKPGGRMVCAHYDWESQLYDGPDKEVWPGEAPGREAVKERQAPITPVEGRSMSIVTAAPRVYAAFPRRLQALVLDVALLVSSLVAVAIAIPALPDTAAPAVWIGAVLLFVLYEPLLVSRTGGTIGHHLMNLRVQRERAPERIGFGRALLRSWIKGILGIASFVAMLLTRRHQAVHDSFTRSVVVIHDMSRARPFHYLEERPEPVDARVTVSRFRRSLVIVAYAAGIFLLTAAAPLPFVSFDCYELDRCTDAENLIFSVTGLVMIAGFCVLIVAGWKGKLPGARTEVAVRAPVIGA